MDEHSGHILLSRGGNEDAPRGQTALVVTAVLTGMSIVVVAMRIYTRIGLIKLSGREDWTILVSLVCITVVLFSTLLISLRPLQLPI